MTSNGLRAWYLLHRWSSLLCTLILLVAFVTGLPLVFQDELRALAGEGVHAAAPENAVKGRNASLNQVIRAGLNKHPGNVLLYVMAKDDLPGVYIVDVGATLKPLPKTSAYELVDAKTARVLPKSEKGELILGAILQLHKALFLALPGELLLGATAILFVISLVSGAVVYGPFMRKLDFGEIRFAQAAGARWLDLHNLLGIVVLVWALVVGLTGTINSLAAPAFQLWRSKELASMLSLYRGLPTPMRICSPQEALSAAEHDEPGMTLDFMVPPGHIMAGDHHYSVFMHGKTPLTSQLLKPILVDAETGRVSAKREMPWYIQVLLLAKPLHFGDYGGFPLKVIWALLDFMTIIVLVSGIYLWLGKRVSKRTEVKRREPLA